MSIQRQPKVPARACELPLVRSGGGWGGGLASNCPPSAQNWGHPLPTSPALRERGFGATAVIARSHPHTPEAYCPTPITVPIGNDCSSSRGDLNTAS
jgi:hypothetical protein